MVAAADELATGLTLGRRFVEAIVAHDWDGLAGCFAPDARFLAVVANETTPFREKVGGQAAAEQIRRWFGDAVETGFERMNLACSGFRPVPG